MHYGYTSKFILSHTGAWRRVPARGRLTASASGRYRLGARQRYMYGSGYGTIYSLAGHTPQSRETSTVRGGPDTVRARACLIPRTYRYIGAGRDYATHVHVLCTETKACSVTGQSVCWGIPFTYSSYMCKTSSCLTTANIHTVQQYLCHPYDVDQRRRSNFKSNKVRPLPTHCT